MSDDHNNHGERIAGLEAGQRALQQSIKDLAEIVADQASAAANEHRQTRAEITMLGDKMAAVGKPNWNVVVSGVGIVLLIIGALFAPTQLQLSEIKGNQNQITQDLRQHRELPVHPVAAAVLEERETIEKLRFAAVEQQLAAQREVLELKIKIANANGQPITF